MELQNVTSRRAGTNASRHALSRMEAAAEEKLYFPHAHVPILEDGLDDDVFEPDGVNDFARDHASWDPDREF